MATDAGKLLVPSSALLENHFAELLEAIEEIRGLTTLLKSLPPANETCEEYEGRLYAALPHLDHHVKPAIKEWDRGRSDGWGLSRCQFARAHR